MDTFRALHLDQAAHYTWWRQWGGAHERNIGWRIDYILGRVRGARREFLEVFETKSVWKAPLCFRLYCMLERDPALYDSPDISWAVDYEI